VLKPVPLHGRGVADKPEQGGQRGHEAPPGLLLGQAAKLATEHPAVVLDESFQGFPFTGDRHKVLFIHLVRRGRRICHRKRL